jgi:UDP-N-acetylmuramoyl-L-alanyl-D-glutamate--2,6-diaminopimelate ligase
MIGVSGTYGKTTTSYLIAGMLAESGSPVGLIGTLGIFDGEKVYPSTQTTPPPDELAYWLMLMVANGCSHAIIEISSQAIAESHLAGLKFDAMCLTNIRRNHLDYHGSIESYRRTKFLAFRSLRKKGIAVCNADDRVTAAILPLIDHPVLTVGIRNPCEVSGTSLDCNLGDQTFLITAGNETVPLSTKMIGDENLYNCLTATALGIGLGIDFRVAVRGIERVKSVPGRLERIDCGQPFGVFVDSAPTPESLAGALRSLRQVVSGRLFCVLGIDKPSPTTILNSDSLRPLCKTLKNWTDVTVLTADELRSPDGTVDPVSAEKIIQELPGHHVQVIETRPEAIHWALSNAEPDDCVLIVGRGCTDFQRFLEVEDVNLCDRPFVKSWLYEANYQSKIMNYEHIT